MLYWRSRLLVVLALLLLIADNGWSADADKPRLDSYGDPLPTEASQRFGAARFRTVFSRTTATLSPDGKIVALGDPKGVTLLDVATGERLRQLRAKEFHFQPCIPVFTPDSKRVGMLTGSELCLFDCESGKPSSKIVADELNSPAQSYFVSFSEDGKRVAIGDEGKDGFQRGGNRTITIWDTEAVKKLHTLEIADAVWINVTWSGDGKIFAATYGQCSGDGQFGKQKLDGIVRLWDADTGKERKKISLECEFGRAVAFSPNGKSLAVLENNKMLSVWSVESAQNEHRIAVRDFSGPLLRYSPDGKTLVVGTQNGALQVFDAATAKRRAIVRGLGVNEATVLAFLPKDKLLVGGMSGQAFKLWEAPSGRLLTPDVIHYSPVDALCFTSDGQTMMSGGADGIRTWNVATGKILPQKSSETPPISWPVLAFAPKGRHTVTSSGWNSLRIVETESREEVFSVDANLHPNSRTVHYSNDGTSIFAVDPSGGNCKVLAWDAISGRKQLAKTIEHGDEFAVAMSPDGKSILIAANSHGRVGERPSVCQLTLWDLRTGKERWTQTLQERWITHLTFSPNGQFFAAGATDFHLYETATAKELGQFEKADNITTKFLVFSPDGRMLAACEGEAQESERKGKILLWETASYKRRLEFSGCPGGVTAVAFAPDNSLLATAAGDTSILLWDLTGKYYSAELAQGKPQPQNYDALWNDLNGQDAEKALRLIQHLARHPVESIALLKLKLPPAKAAKTELEVIDKLIIQMDHDEFEQREEASKVLAKVGRPAFAALTKALQDKPSPEKKRRLTELLDALNVKGPTPAMVRPTRALEVLERINTAEARMVLEDLAKGDPDAQLTQNAKAALQRLANRAIP